MDADLKHQLARGLEDSAVGLALFDPDDRLRHANRWFIDTYGVTLADAPTWSQMMRDCHQKRHGVLIATDDFDSWLARVRLKYRQVPVRSFESDMVDGRWVWVTETLGADGWLTTICCDVTALKAHEATLRKARDEALIASFTDPLTDLYNRRFVFKRLDDLLSSVRSMRVPLCVAVLDLDHFKRINDTHGHGVGDRVLQHFARQLMVHRRPLDVVGRIGGEEFLLVLPNSTLEGAETALTRLRQLVTEPAAGAAAPPAYGFSAGLTAATAEDTVDRVVGRADRALYLAKKAGRGRHRTLEDSSDDAAQASAVPSWMGTLGD